MAVLNKYHHGGRVPDGAINIMRGTEWGNPFPVGQFTREDSIALYRELLWRRLRLEPGLAEKVRALHGRDLCCCCAPKACHGDVLARAAAWLAGRDGTLAP
jgi:hypothetical protein